MASRPAVLLIGTVALVLVAGGAYLWQQLARSAEAAEKRRVLLEDVQREAGKETPDSDELSRLMQRLDEWKTGEEDRELTFAKARIEHARGRHDRALAAVEQYVRGGDATASELRFAAELHLARHALGLRASAGEQCLRQALGDAENAARASDDPADLLLAWTAAVRLATATNSQPDAEQASRLTERIVADHPGSAAARFVAAARDYRPDAPPSEDLERLAAAMERPPAELATLRASVLLLAEPAPRAAEAVALLEPVVQRHPGLVEPRNVLATALHVAAAAEADLDRRDRYVTQRDAHLAWLVENAAANDARHANWAQMRNTRY